MSEKELNVYRFISGQDPSDDMLEQIMKEMASTASKTNKQAHERLIQNIHNNIIANQSKWNDRINEIYG